MGSSHLKNNPNELLLFLAAMIFFVEVVVVTVYHWPSWSVCKVFVSFSPIFVFYVCVFFTFFSPLSLLLTRKRQTK